MQTPPAFWDRIAPKYARKPVDNPGAYEATLKRVRSHLSSRDRVLELGCGTGSTALVLAPCVASYTATDYSEGMIAIAQAKVATGDHPNLSFAVAGHDGPPEGTWDAILAFNLLHLVRGTEGALADLRERLNPGGLLITKSPCLGGKPWLNVLIAAMRLVGKAPYVRFFTVAGYDRMIREAGFEIVETGLYPAKPPSRFVVARRV